MNRRARMLTSRVLSIVAIFAATATSAIASAPTKALGIELDESSMLVPTHVTYQWTQEGLEVKGRIEKKRDRYGRILGHAEIEFLDGQGHVLSRYPCSLQHFNPRRKDPDWASFRTVIEVVPSGAEKLRVRHATGTWR